MKPVRTPQEWKDQWDRIMAENAETMSIARAARIAQETGDTTHLVTHWDRTRVALICEVIRDFLDDVPPGVGVRTQARLEDAMTSVRADLDRMGRS